jgi:hypothetical protein
MTESCLGRPPRRPARWVCGERHRWRACGRPVAPHHRAVTGGKESSRSDGLGSRPPRFAGAGGEGPASGRGAPDFQTLDRTIRALNNEPVLASGGSTTVGPPDPRLGSSRGDICGPSPWSSQGRPECSGPRMPPSGPPSGGGGGSTPGSVVAEGRVPRRLARCCLLGLTSFASVERNRGGSATGQ